jgi:fermentation-respiration switch protein FrsA (DUF1100 family)
MTTALAVLAVLILGYGAIVGGLYAAQRSMMYHPDGARPQPAPPLDRTVTVTEIPAHDGLALFTWWAPPPSAEAPVLVYFHGNAGSQADRAQRMAAFIAQGWGVVMPGYRYNAGAGGEPSEEALIADGHAVLDWLGAQGVAPGRRILFGESLGSGLAVALAAEADHAAGIVLDAPFDSIEAVAAAAYWYVPVRRLLKDRFRSDIRIASVDVPVLIGHGGEDRIIPPDHGRRLFAAANEPKRFAFKPEAGHTDLFDHGFFGDVQSFVAEVTARD